MPGHASAAETVDGDVPQRRFPVLETAWFALLLVLVYLPVIIPMVREWYTQDEMGHGFFVLPVVGYLVWERRAELLAIPRRTTWAAIVLVPLGFVVALFGYLGSEFFVARVGFLLSVVGVLWTLLGSAILRRLVFPFCVMLFMLRIPLFIYSQITFPLQLFASGVAEHLLGWMGIPVLREGNVLELASQRLSVVEACSGIRSLISLGFLSLVYGYMFDRRTWMRVVLFLLTVPIAILANAGRVTMTGVLYEYKPEYAQGVYHSLEGWVIFLVAFVALVASQAILGRLATGLRHANH